MKTKSIALVIVVLVVLFIFPLERARADVAPPEAPPGSNLVPGSETTQVRMMAETVTLAVSVDPSNEKGAVAQTTATFTMRNLGSTEESMQARFPLSFFNGNSDGFGRFPEIPGITVKVNGKTVSTQRELQPFLPTSGPSYEERAQVPWAVFNVTFPPGQDVTIEVHYTVNGFGYYPYETFKYILETGAGWKDTIGSVDIIVRLPYEANSKNVWLSDATTGYSETSAGVALDGDVVRWHYENLEPTWENNIEITVVTPSLWSSILKDINTVTRNPNDGEAWGRLGLAYKDIIRMKHGDLRTDAVGRELYELSRKSYEKCLALLPNDPLWHYGYADLLWSHYYFDLYMMGVPDTEGILPLTLTHLQAALRLVPNNQLAKDLLTNISYSVPGAVEVDGDNFVLLGLTATPLPPTPYLVATETAMPTLTQLPPPTQPVSSPAAPIELTPTATNPLCGGAALILPAVMGVLWLSRRKR